MVKFINDIRDFWDKKGFEIVFWGSLILIFICIVMRIGKDGKYDEYMWDDSLFVNRQKIKIEKEKKESTGEAVCRKYLEQRFRKPFRNIRPDFLRNQVTSSGNKQINLELDCYNPELRLAVEYNGAQHYKYIPYFHKNNEAFLNQKYRDEMKKYKCRDMGIVLIEVPYTVKNIEGHIESELLKHGY